MRKLVLAAVILAITATTADARRRHHRFMVYREAPVMLMAPGADTRSGVADTRFRRTRVDPMQRIDPMQLIPRDWQLMAPDPNWQGRRYVSPDRDAWLAFYATNAANDAQARFKAVAFADGENVTYLRGERDRLTVSGLKGDSIFYRKVTLACGGTIWRHVAMEYPAAAKAKFDGFVERLSRGFEQIADDACGDNLFASPQPASAQPKPDDKPAN
jgi:hypothetical protein